MADQEKNGFTQQDILKQLMAASIRMEARIDAIVHSQSYLLAQAKGTKQEDELAILRDAIENHGQAMLDKVINWRNKE